MTSAAGAFRSIASRLACAVLLAAVAIGASVEAQSPQLQLAAGRNVNMVSGTKWPTGDPYLQRQNEPSVAGSTRNPLHLLAGANDYRTVDIPFVSGAEETGDAWHGLFKSFDGGQRWVTNLLPGYPQDTSPEGQASPLFLRKSHPSVAVPDLGYQAGADPVVRAGTNGLLYYSGLAFNREENGRSAIFVARFIDNNDKENGDPIKYLGTTIVAQSPGGPSAAFLDKPTIAVDIPRNNAGTCRIETSDVDPVTNLPRNIVQTIPAGVAYVAYTSLTEDAQGPKAEILLSRSTNCGKTWTAPRRISRSQDRVNQGATMAIDPRNGYVYVTWRRIGATENDEGDGIMVARSINSGRDFWVPDCVRRFPRAAHVLARLHKFFEHRRRGPQPSEVGEDLDGFDQATTDVDGLLSFRTNAYPTMVLDGNGRLYVAWSERGLSTTNAGSDARVVIATSSNGFFWTPPQAVANGEPGQAGHQIMPSLAFGGGKLVLIYYDLREDVSGQFTQFIDDRTAIQTANRRHTLDLRASLGTPGSAPAFQPSVRVSDYLVAEEDTPGGVVARQLQYNPPNLPMFKQGTAPFMGDYVDVTLSPAFVPSRNGRWTYNTSGPMPVFHAVWTDNRDVRQPTVAQGAGGSLNPWATYTPPTQRTGASLFDPTQSLPACNPTTTGSRNQNIYTARLTLGLVVGSPGNTKPLSPTLQRGFSVFAQNTTSVTKAFRLTVVTQPPGGRASFDQFVAMPSIDVTTPPRSLAARTLYVTSSDNDAQVNVDVKEISVAGGAIVTGGLADVIVLNPDIANPDIANPDIANPDIANPDIANAEVYNPDIANPDIANPDIANPDIANPDIANPDIANPDIANPDIANPDIANVEVANPDIANPDIANPDIANPDIANPDIANPDIANPDIANSTITDVTWTITNTGNTAASYNVNLFLAQQTSKICASGETPESDGCIATQLILRKVYNTPTATNCTIEVQSQNVLIANIANPKFVLPTEGVPSQNDPSITNATLWLAPGEVAKITLRIADPVVIDNQPALGGIIDPVFLPSTQTSGGVVTPVVTQQGANTTDVSGGTVTKYATSIAFAQHPTRTPAGLAITPAVTVQVRDQFGVPLKDAAVTIALGANPAGATLTGGESVLTDVSGIATFPALTLDQGGPGYTLTATVIGAGSASLMATSMPFDVPLVVLTTNDAGANSLRDVMTQANGTPGVPETIVFAIPGPTPHVIGPLSPLPAIVDPVTIDGTSQPGYDGRPVVEVNGTGTFGWGFEIDTSSTTIRGLAIAGFPDTGIFAWQSHAGHVIEDNYIGTDRLGSFGKGNVGGLRIRAHYTTVQRNVISGNLAFGILLELGATNNVVSSNLIGTSPDGLTALPNASGIDMYDGVLNTAFSGNRISGNNGWGIDIQQSGALAYVTGTRILGNEIGLSASGLALPNGQTNPSAGGVKVNLAPGTIIGLPGMGNVISGNNGPGIQIHGTVGPIVGGVVANAPAVKGNYIGTNAAGTLARPNGQMGIWVTGISSGNIIGGSAPGESNVISGNSGTGIVIRGDYNQVLGNFVGTTASGAAALGNGGIGVHVEGAQYNTVGGTGAGERNVLSGNTRSGVFVGGLASYFGRATTGNTVKGNFIGLNGAGAAPIPNLDGGVDIRESANLTSLDDNVISGNTGVGVRIIEDAANNAVRRNKIGTSPAGALLAALGNTGVGVSLDRAIDNTIGGTGANGNVIAGNGAQGVTVTHGTSAGNRIQFNRIFSNTGLGIDLGADGFTANDSLDADAGPNGLQNAPVINGVTLTGLNAFTELSFTLDSAPNSDYTLEFFSGSACDAGGRGEGEVSLGTIDVSTLANGQIVGLLLLGEALAPGAIVTATATDAAGNTSEFSNCGALADVPGTAGGTVNDNHPGGAAFAGGTAPVSTGITLAAGQFVTITAAGLADNYPFDALTWTPNGDGTFSQDIGDYNYLANDISRFSLMARVGTGPWQFVGVGPTQITAVAGGVVELAMNDSTYSDNSGAFQVSIIFGAPVP